MLQRSKIIRIGQIAIASFLLFQIIFSYAGQGILVARAQVPGGLKPATSGVTGQVPVYQGVDTSISKYLCTPDDSNLGGSLFICITKAYRFGIAFGAIALVFFVVLAGYFYITGGEGAKTKGKSIFTSALTGMAIILGSYVLLGFINPDLLKIKPIQPPIFSASNLPKCSDVGLGIQCVLPNGNVNLNGSNGGATGGGIINGYNIGAYATNPQHEQNVLRIYNTLRDVDFSTAAAVNAQLKKMVASTPLTGQMVVNSANKFKVDAKLMVAMMMEDSALGTQGKGARTHNPGNVGNDDTGQLVDYGTWEKGVDAVANWLNRHRA